MIFHENRLPADDSHEIPCLICYFLKSDKISAANYRWRNKLACAYSEDSKQSFVSTPSVKTLSFLSEETLDPVCK